MEDKASVTIDNCQTTSGKESGAVAASHMTKGGGGGGGESSPNSPNTLSEYEPSGGGDDATYEDYVDYTGAVEPPPGGLGNQVQSSVIVFILILLWFYTIAMFIRRSRFLRTTGQRQSTYKSGLPTASTAVPPNPSISRSNSLAATNVKRNISQAKNIEVSIVSDVNREKDNTLKSPEKSDTDHKNSITSLDDRVLCNHITPKKSAMKISLPSWRVERNREEEDSVYRTRKMSFTDSHWEPYKPYHKKKFSNDSAIAPVLSLSQISNEPTTHKGASPVGVSSKTQNRLVASHNNPKFSLTTDSSSYVISVDADDIIDDKCSYEMSEKSPGAESQLTITNDTSEISTDLQQPHSSNTFN